MQVSNITTSNEFSQNYIPIIKLKQIPGGWLSYKFGSRRLLTASILIGSIFTMFIPVCAQFHYAALIACLFFTGLTHGAFWPSVSGFWVYWAPHSERSRMVGIASSGAKVGNIAALSLGGILCLHGWGGWRSIFYTFGSLGVCWSILFFVLSADSPRNHRFISETERNYILSDTKKAQDMRAVSV